MKLEKNRTKEQKSKRTWEQPAHQSIKAINQSPLLSCSLALLLCCSLALLLSSPSHAQQISLSISPPLLEVVVKPGKSLLVAYTLENSGDPTVIRPRVLPFEPKGIMGNIQLKDQFEGPIQFSLENNNIQLEQPFFLRNQSSQQLLLRIRVPEGAPEGDYYYSFLNESDPPPMIDGITNSRAKVTIGSNILITVTHSGDLDIKSKVSLFDVLPTYSLPFLNKRLRVFDSFDKIPVTLQVENQGNNIIKPEGTITLRGNFGEQSHHTVLSQNILSHSQRLLSATPSAEINCKTGKNSLCESPFSLILSGFFLGNYKLSTTLNFGEGTPTIFASTSFLAFPFKYTAGIFLTIFLSFIIFKRIKKDSE